MGVNDTNPMLVSEPDKPSSDYRASDAFPTTEPTTITDTILRAHNDE